MYEDEGSPFADLTAREWAVFSLVASGMSHHEVASALHIASGTTRIHVRELLWKLNVGSRKEVARLFGPGGTVVGTVKAWGEGTRESSHRPKFRVRSGPEPGSSGAGA